MNYQRIYDSLIEKRRISPLNRTDNVERHHILPRSWGGTDDASNLIFLTYREHFLAHRLLSKIPASLELKLKMIYAVKRMCKHDKFNGREYQRITEQWHRVQSLYMSEVIGENGESRRQLTTRRSAKTMAETVMNGKNLQELRFSKISKNNKEIHEWEHLDGRTFTGTAFELSRSHRGELIEPAKMMKFLNTPTRHRGWRSKIGAQSQSPIEKRYTEVYSWTHLSGLDFVGTAFELHKLSGLYSNKLQKITESGKMIGGWRIKQ